MCRPKMSHIPKFQYKCDLLLVIVQTLVVPLSGMQAVVDSPVIYVIIMSQSKILIRPSGEKSQIISHAMDDMFLGSSMIENQVNNDVSRRHVLGL
jgi:hypothetical protein